MKIVHINASKLTFLAGMSLICQHISDILAHCYLPSPKNKCIVGPVYGLCIAQFLI